MINDLKHHVFICYITFTSAFSTNEIGPIGQSLYSFEVAAIVLASFIAISSQIYPITSAARIRLPMFLCGYLTPIAKHLAWQRVSVRCPCCKEQRSDTGYEPAGHINPQHLLL